VQTDEEPSVSGALACGLRDVLAEVVGKERVETALDQVEPDVAASYRNVTSVGWLPIRVLEDVFGEVARSQGKTTAELHVEVARTSIERTMRTLWRLLLRLTTDNALISRTPVIFAKSYNRGRLTAEIPESGRAKVSLLDWPNPPEWPLRATRIGIETVLRIAGRQNVEVRYTRTPDGALYSATWR
jgi:hypothetical protein